MTIKDLARETGYSIGTVSRALNDHPNVSDKARKTILAAVERYGFSVNANAKNLKQQRSKSIIAIVKGTSNDLFAAMVEQMQKLFYDSKYELITDYIDEDDNEVRRAVQLCAERKPLGVLFLGGSNRNFRTDFQKISVPCVIVTNDARELHLSGLSSVSTDDRAAARCAVDRLFRSGHRRIALLGGGDRSDTSHLRYLGWADSCEAHGVAPERLPCTPTRYSYQGGYLAMREVLKRSPDVTAAFAVADVVAIGAMRAIREAGKHVPEDVSVVGFDGLQIGAYMSPQLTSVRQDIRQLAVRSVRILTDCIENGRSASHETVEFSLIEGESVASPKEK